MKLSSICLIALLCLAAYCMVNITPGSGQEEELDLTYAELDEPYYSKNVALASAGATAVASSTYNNPPYIHPPEAAINGERAGSDWFGTTGGWGDSTWRTYPDWIEVRFNGSKTISAIDVFTMQDDLQHPIQPTLDTRFSLYGITDFQVSYWNGASWMPLGSRTSNRNVWTQFKFSPVTTTAIRLVVTNALGDWTRVTEVEAWGNDASMVSAFEPSASATPTPPKCEKKEKPDPCGMLENLAWTFNGSVGPIPHPNWQTRLDWDFNKHRIGSSENWGPVAHALALWRPQSEFTVPAGMTRAGWWHTFFNCQNREADDTTDLPQVNETQRCPGTLAAMGLEFYRRHELFSNNYDGDVLAAVVSVRHWAIKNGHSDLALKATLFLRHTWVLYALGAGKAEALREINRDTPNGKNCQRGGNGTWFWGPYVALAGMRSTPAHSCQDQRSFIFARALGWRKAQPWKEMKGFHDVLDFIERDQPQLSSNPFRFENAYGFESDHIGLVNEHILNGTRADLLTNFIARVRTSVPYHILGYEVRDAAGNKHQARLTLMEESLNGNTVATYAVKYEFNPDSARHKTVQYLFPFISRTGGACGDQPWRLKPIPHGMAFFSGNEVIAKGLAPGEFNNCHNAGGSSTNPIVDQMVVPPGNLIYHVVLGRDLPPRRVF